MYYICVCNLTEHAILRILNPIHDSFMQHLKLCVRLNMSHERQNSVLTHEKNENKIDI